MARFRPHLEILEEREVPSATVVDANSFSLGFMADNSDVYGLNSTFYQTFQGSTEAAQKEVLRAFQTWAAAANINFGLISSGIAADIQIGAAALASNFLAVNSALNANANDAGKVVINTQKSFSVNGDDGYDLYSGMLNEVGNLLGLADNNSPTSALYNTYAGVRSGLSAADIAAIQGLYGIRAADSFEGKDGNNTMKDATKYSASLTADLTTSTDVDWYSFKVDPKDGATTIQLNAAGFSLLTARLTVFDANGGIVATTSANDPTNNDLTLKLSNLNKGDYFVKIEGNGSDVFRIGAYQLSVNSDKELADAAEKLARQKVVTLSEKDLTDPKAQNVNTESSALIKASLAFAGEVDVYKVHTPDAKKLGNATTMLIDLKSTGRSSLDLNVEVYDGKGNRVAANVLVSSNSKTTIEINNIEAGKDYYVRVFSETNSTGNYHLKIQNVANASQLALQTTGNLSSTQTGAGGQLQVSHAQAIHFVLSGSSIGGSTSTAVEMTIRNSLNQVLAVLTASPGTAQSLDLYLAAGNYSIQLRAVSSSGGAIGNVSYSLSACSVSDPISVAPADPTSAPVAPSAPITNPQTSTTVTEPLLPLINWVSSFLWQTTPTGGTVSY